MNDYPLTEQFVRRTVFGISILLTEFRRWIRYICARSRRLLLCCESNGCQRDVRISRSDGGSSGNVDPGDATTANETYFLTWRNCTAGSTCSVSTLVLWRQVWRIRDLFASSFAFMKLAIVTTCTYSMYNWYRPDWGIGCRFRRRRNKRARRNCRELRI